ncbi:MAG: DUF6526 family protein [Thermoanaerobaculia bacterium]|nr:DUF6526 family protein [Thermoanaerobaculia bacterium]
MGEKKPQSLANHRKFVPLYHFALTGVLVIYLGWQGWRLIQSFSAESVMGVLMALTFIGMLIYARIFALQAQDRVIRLEEQLRMERLLPDELKARVPEIRRRQYVALRFADDAELADRVREAIDEKLSEGEIKKRIGTWRPDYHRL